MDARDDNLCIIDKETDLCMNSNYNTNSEAQFYGASLLSKFIKKEASKLNANLPDGIPLQVLEHGCATGGSSITPLQGILDCLVTSGRRCEVIMNDLPMNSWQVLKETVEPQFPGVPFRYAKKTMYGPVANEGSIHLVYSCYALQWLSKGPPTGLPGEAMWPNQLPNNNMYRKQWKEASDSDWERFLTLRAKEVAKNGVMVLHIQSSDCNGILSERYKCTLMQAKSRMLRAGELSSDEAMSLCVPEYFRSLNEILEPLTNPDKEFLKLWHVTEISNFELPCDMANDINISQDELIMKMICFCRAYMDSSIKSAISDEKVDIFWSYVKDIATTEGALSLSVNVRGTFVILTRK